MAIDRVKDLTRQLFRFEKVTEFEQRRRVRRRLTVQVNADESADGLAVVDGVFDALIGQVEALLGHIHAKHARQSDRWTTGADGLRKQRFPKT